MASVTFDPTTEKCGMCFGSWTSRGDIRALPCHHGFCLLCLQENQLLNKRTVCPNCRHDHARLDLKSLDVVFQGQPQDETEINNACGTEGCGEMAIFYCIGCPQQYCANHLKFHNQLISTHEVVEMSEYRSREAGLPTTYCEAHPNQALTVACDRCYTMKCELCDDQADDRCAENEEHKLHTIGRVAGSLSSDIRQQLEEFRDREVEMFTKLKDVLSQGDSIGEYIRIMLSTIDETAANMKVEIDLQADRLKQEVLDYHREITLQMEAVTNTVNGFTDNSSDWSKTANEMLRKSKADLIRGSSELIDRARLILTTECPEFEPVLKTLSRSGKEKLIFPLSLELNFPSPPSAARLKSSIQTPAHCYTLTHLTTGQLVHAGDYKLTGSEFGVKYDGGCLFSLYEHAGCLYILQWTKGYKHIHMLNLSTGDCSYSVIKYKDICYQSGLAVNDQHIITINMDTKAVKVFSSTDYSLQYDMKIDCLSGWPCGIAQLPDGSLVVSDYYEGLVCNFTVDRNPTVNWVCRDLVQPTGITIDTAGNSILVASCRKKKVHVLSFSGEKLHTISLPECKCIEYISIRDNELAVAAGRRVKLYELIR